MPASLTSSDDDESPREDQGHGENGQPVRPDMSVAQEAVQQQQEHEEATRGRGRHPDRRPTPNGTSHISHAAAQGDQSAHSPSGNGMAPGESPNSLTMSYEAQAAARAGNATFGGGYMTGIDDPTERPSRTVTLRVTPAALAAITGHVERTSAQHDGAEDSGEEADAETLGSPPQRPASGNENAWIPEGVAGPSRILRVPQITRGPASDVESEASIEPPSSIPQHNRYLSPQDSAADVGFSSEGEYVRQQALLGGVSGNLLTPSETGTPNVTSDSESVMMQHTQQTQLRSLQDTSADAGYMSESEYVRGEALQGGVSGSLLLPSQASATTATSDSDGLMMAPSSRSLAWQLANRSSRSSTIRDSARGRSPPGALMPIQNRQEDSMNSETVSRYQRHEQIREERRAMQRLHRYAELGDETARQLVEVHNRRVTDWEHGGIRVFQQLEPSYQSMRVPHAFPPRFARRSVQLVELQRRGRSEHLLAATDDRALVLPWNSSAPQPSDGDLPPYLSGRVAQDMKELIEADAVDSLDDDTTARARNRWAWSVPPIYRETYVAESRRRRRSASPRLISHAELPRTIANISAEHELLGDRPSQPPPIEIPSQELAQAFRASLYNLQTNIDTDAQRQRQMGGIHGCSLLPPGGLAPADRARLYEMALNPDISDAAFRQHFLALLELRSRQYGISQTSRHAPPGLQLGDAPYNPRGDTQLRSPVVQERIATWQQRNQTNERSTSRQPAGQGPQQSQGHEHSAPRDSVGRGDMEEDKGDDRDVVEGGEEVS